MLLQKSQVTRAQARQQLERRERFAAATADIIGNAVDCLYSLLPYQERRRQAANWYESCAQAMLRGNFAPLDAWIREQSCLAAEEHFELQDLVQLLRICRRSAIQTDGWDEDVFSALDDVINEGLHAIRGNVSWNIPDHLDYRKIAEIEPALPTGVSGHDSMTFGDVREGERRVSGRNQLALPIRVRCITERFQNEEITCTQNVSMAGLYFRTQQNYPVGSPLLVTYPFWTGPGSINKEYSARVARLDPLPDRFCGIAVEFLQNLRDKSG